MTPLVLDFTTHTFLRFPFFNVNDKQQTNIRGVLKQLCPKSFCLFTGENQDQKISM